jgi:diguanylate cyclase (GGDEF)-like protein
MRMGVHLGQGYFLSRPQFPKPGLEPQVRKYFSANARMSIGDRRFSKPVRALLEEVPKVAPDVTVGEVKKMLEEGGPISSVVVEEGGRPKGLVMSHHLDRALSSQYGVAVYYNRPISLIMDPQPLYAEAGTPVENVAREAMTRKKNKVFDHIVITEQGKLAGIVSVQNMLDNMAKHQVEMAKGANPLTGLPGHVVIELELERRSRSKKPFSVVYADLDNFKVYNDTYGFKNGDNILLLLTRILSFAIRRHGHPDEDFVGHIGGDDFMMITAPERAERVCKSVTRCFSRLVKNCYMPQDRQRGWVEARSRTGELRKYPLVSVSLAMVECLGVCEPSELGRRAAEMKKFAKSIPGNSYVKDRRGPLGGAQRANPLSFTDNPDD